MTAPNLDHEEPIGTAEAAQIIGFSVKHTKDLARANKIPHYQTGPRGNYRYLVSELRAWQRGEWKPKTRVGK